MVLSRAEMETIIRFDESTDAQGRVAEVYTYNGKLKRKLSKLCEERPGECRQTESDGYGGVTFECPKGWIRVNASRILSDEQRAKATAQLKSIVK